MLCQCAVAATDPPRARCGYLIASLSQKTAQDGPGQAPAHVWISAPGRKQPGAVLEGLTTVTQAGQRAPGRREEPEPSRRAAFLLLVQLEEDLGCQNTPESDPLRSHLHQLRKSSTPDLKRNSSRPFLASAIAFESRAPVTQFFRNSPGSTFQMMHLPPLVDWQNTRL